MKAQRRIIQVNWYDCSLPMIPLESRRNLLTFSWS